MLIVQFCRKLPLLMGLIGKFIFSIMIVVNTIKPDWPVEYVIYTATIPAAFTGAGEFLCFEHK
jgi:MFS transporter, PCFT/HCP family, solute carrier family 46, member 3